MPDWMLGWPGLSGAASISLPCDEALVVLPDGWGVLGPTLTWLWASSSAG